MCNMENVYTEVKVWLIRRGSKVLKEMCNMENVYTEVKVWLIRRGSNRVKSWFTL